MEEASDNAAAAARWTRLFGPHLDAAYRLARWLTGSAHEAEEVVQDACLRAWSSANRSDPADPRAWLLAVTRNAAWTRLRRAAARPAGTGKVVPFDEAVRDLPSAESGPEAAVAGRQRQAALRRALVRLPPPFREVVALRDIEDLSYVEIAAVLGLPVGTVMSRLSRGRRRLHAMLAEENGDGARDTAG